MKTRTVAAALTLLAVALLASASFACGNKSSKSASSAKSASAPAAKATYVNAEAKPAGVVEAVPVGGASCGTAAKSSKMASHTGCEICDEYAGCNEKLTIAGASTQVVPLKNGVMFVYTSDSEKTVHSVQSAVRLRHDRILEIVTAGHEAKLCPGCESMRGSMASGKMNREIVNIEGGSLTLVTSEDPKVVRSIQEVAGITPKSTKS
jgi:hypothetical protein